MSDAEMAEIQDWARAWGRYIVEGGWPDHITVDADLHEKMRRYVAERTDCLGESLIAYDGRLMFDRIPLVVK